MEKNRRPHKWKLKDCCHNSPQFSSGSFYYQRLWIIFSTLAFPNNTIQQHHARRVLWRSVDEEGGARRLRALMEDSSAGIHHERSVFFPRHICAASNAPSVNWECSGCANNKWTGPKAHQCDEGGQPVCFRWQRGVRAAPAPAGEPHSADPEASC